MYEESSWCSSNLGREHSQRIIHLSCVMYCVTHWSCVAPVYISWCQTFFKTPTMTNSMTRKQGWQVARWMWKQVTCGSDTTPWVTRLGQSYLGHCNEASGQTTKQIPRNQSLIGMSTNYCLLQCFLRIITFLQKNWSHYFSQKLLRDLQTLVEDIWKCDIKLYWKYI